MKYILFFPFFLFVISISRAQDKTDKGLQAISQQTVEAPLKFLASDWTEGREAGTKGAYMAADYIATVFQMYGIKPLGDMEIKSMSRELRLKGKKPESVRSYFQNFDLISETRNKPSELIYTRTTGYSKQVEKLVEGADYQLLRNYGSLEFDAPVVFLGYGIRNKALKCDHFQGVDIEGKIVFLLSGFAGVNDQDSKNMKILKRDSLFTESKLEAEKIENAKEAGALAVLRYNPHRSFQAASPQNLPMFHDNDYYEGDRKREDYYQKKISLPRWNENERIPVIQIGKFIAETMLAKKGALLSSMQESGYDMTSFKALELEGSSFQLKVENDQKVIRARNVLGCIEGKNTDQAVVIGAHYDHVGKYNGFIFNGADDNASGTAGMVTLARAFAESGRIPEKTIVFAAWTAEEQGLWGSKYFVRNVPDDLNIVLNINLDMIGRTSIKDSSENYLSIQYTKRYEAFEQILSHRNITNDLNLDIRFKPEMQPKGGSDFASFAREGIPVISFYTGTHRDYHMPNDELGSIDIRKMTDIVKLTYLGLIDIFGYENEIVLKLKR